MKQLDIFIITWMLADASIHNTLLNISPTVFFLLNIDLKRAQYSSVVVTAVS